MSPSTATRRPATKQTGGRPSLTDQRRRRELRLRRLRRALVLFAVAALLVTAGWVVGISSVFATQDVKVSGTKLLTVDGVTSAAAVPMGLPLARQNTSAIADRISALAPVESVSVDRGWPHTLSISVVERTPLTAVKAAGGYLLVDRTGVGFDTVPSLPAGVVEVDIDSGNAALLADAGTIVSSVPADLRAKIATISGKQQDSFTVTLESGLVITWGNADQSALKGQVALLLLHDKPKAIDVSAPHSPAIR